MSNYEARLAEMNPTDLVFELENRVGDLNNKSTGEDYARVRAIRSEIVRRLKAAE